MSFRPLPILTVFTLASLVILILLGNWQYDRYREKEARGPEEAAAFQSVRVEIDRDNPGMAQQVYGLADGETIWRRYVPGRVNGEGPIVLALWDATSGIQPVPLAIAETGEAVERPANRFARAPISGGETGDADVWQRFNTAGIMARLGYIQDTAEVVEPDQITIRLADDLSRARKTENPYASERPRDPLPPERHFGYALTWWGMAIALLAVYLAFHHSQGRLRFKERA